MNRQTQRRWAVLAAGLFLVSGCADGLELDRDDDISEHQEGILELSERIVFESECHERRRRDCEDGEHHGTFVANPEGPRILRFEMPFEFRAGQDFYFEFEAAPEQTPKWLALTVEGSFFSHLAPLTQVGNRWIARGHFELRHREDEPFAPRQMLRLQLVDEDMTAGRALRVPINFVDELRGTPSPRGVGLSGTTPAEALLFDGDMLWQGGGDGTLVRWSGTSGGPELTIDAHDGIVHDLALVDSGVLSVGADGMLLHHSREGELLWAVQAHDGVARALAVHQDIAITGGWDGKVVAFALEDGERLWETELGERVNDVIGGFHGSCLAALGRIALPGELVRLGEGGVIEERVMLPADGTAMARSEEHVLVAHGRGGLRLFDAQLQPVLDMQDAPQDTTEEILRIGPRWHTLSLGGRLASWTDDGRKLVEGQVEDDGYSFAHSNGTQALGTGRGITWLVDLRNVLP